MEELNEKKTKYFVIAIIILIILGVLLIVHFNNKQMVKGDENKGDTPTTTEKITTTTKKRVKIEEVKAEEVVYKSVIDKDNKLVYNYKLTDEINETDVIISKKLEINETLKEKDVIGLFDISLFDANLVKKSVNNSLITIKIPLTDDLKGYDEYKVIYINEKNEITDETFEVKVDTDYLEFNTTHLSVFGIIGTKKQVVEEIIDLKKVTVDVKVNDEVVENINNILLEKEDKVELVVNNINDDCNVYYGLRATGEEDFTYEKYEGELTLKDGVNYKLFVKVSYVENYEVFELSNIGLYDEVFEYDKNVELEDNVIVGKIESDDETPYDYKDKDINKDIVIDNVTKDEVIETEIVNNEEITNSNATIKVNGNIYLVEKTDISELEMTGHLFIDTDEDIIFAQNIEEKIILDNLYSLTIRSKEFSLNGKMYSYEYTPNGDLVIYDLNTPEIEVEQEETESNGSEEVVEEETTEIPQISVDEFNKLFAGDYEVITDENKKDLIIGIAEPSNDDSTQANVQDENVSGETKVEIETTSLENITE